MLGALSLFLVVFALNVIPAFAPPTWMVLSYVGFRYPMNHVALSAVIAAAAATCGRVLLAKMSRDIVRKKFLSEDTRMNIDAIRERLEARPKFTFSLFLFYAFSPLPSNYLFLAYGLTGMKLPPVAAPFLLGRSISYSFWGLAGAAVSRAVKLEFTEALSYMGAYFIVTQVLLLSILYAFTRVDWRALFEERQFRWTRKRREQNRP
jgi:hypothetical protein